MCAHTSRRQSNMVSRLSRHTSKHALIPYKLMRRSETQSSRAVASVAYRMSQLEH